MAKDETTDHKVRQHGEHRHLEPARTRAEEHYAGWDLDRMMDNFRRDLDRLFWDRIDEHPMTHGRRNLQRPYSPKADIADEGKSYLVTMDLPGMHKKDIHLAVEGNKLVVSAESTVDKETREVDFVLRERGRSQYYRSLALPKEVVPEKCKAEMEDGVLKIMLPKKEPTPSVKSHKIEIA